MDKLRIVVITFTWLVVIGLLTLIHSCELERSRTLKLSFSEIGQIMKDRKSEGGSVDSLTLYLTQVNDMCMKVYEAWHISQNKFSPDMDKSFAFELDISMNQSKKIYHYDLRELFSSIEKSVKDTFEIFKMLPPMIADLKTILMTSEDVWETEKDESGHWEEECSTDSDGNESCHSYYVCDYIDYTYHFNRNKLEQTIQLTEYYIAKNYEIPYYEAILKPASKTNADGEYAVERTRNKEQVTIDIKTYKSDWIHNSTFTNLIGYIRADLTRIPIHLTVIQVGQLSSKTTRYRDNSCGSGRPPKEMRQVREYSSTLATLTGNLTILWNSFVKTKELTPKLKVMIEKFIGTELDYSKEKLDYSSDEILNLTSDIQSINFNRAEKVMAYRKWVIIISSIFLIGIAGWFTFMILQGEFL